MTACQVHCPFEISFTARAKYADIFNDVEMDVLFIGPDGRQWKVPAFWKGGNRFAVRFAPPQKGSYTYQSDCSNPADAGLHGRKGAFKAKPYKGKCELYRHGRLRMAPDKRTLQHQDGKPFFWLGDTWWMALSRRLRWRADWKTLVFDRVKKGFNVVQFVLGPFPDHDAAYASWHPHQASSAGFSWEKDWKRINPKWFDLADMRVKLLAEHGIVPCIFATWGYYLPYMGIERVKKHWRTLVARYSAYPVVFCLAGESNMPNYSVKDLKNEKTQAFREEQEKGWTEIGKYVFALDPFHNIITCHPSGGIEATGLKKSGDSRAVLLEDSFLSLDMLQTGHSGFKSFGSSLKILQEALKREPPMPVINGEVCYEGLGGGSWQDVQRFIFWASVLCGAAGHTYGAMGLWAMSTIKEPYDGTRGSDGEGTWQEGLQFAGSGQLGLGKKLLEKYPWWRMVPMADSLLPQGRLYSYVAGIKEALRIIYLPAHYIDEEFRGLGGKISLEPGSAYEAYFFSPRTGKIFRKYKLRHEKIVQLGGVSPDANGILSLPPRPTPEDWVLVLQNKRLLQELKTGASRMEK